MDRPSMNLELISIPTDTHALDGLYYTPPNTPKNAALFMHGNCMNFYTGPARMVPPPLVQLGYACLAYNRRGHDMIASLNSRGVKGGAFQMTKEAIADNRHAADFLKGRGFAAPIVIGHSNGGMLAVQHAADHPATPALVLLSAHLGGTSIVPHASKVGLLGGEGIDASAGLVVRHHGGKLSGLFKRASRCAGVGAPHHMSGALHPRRQGTRPHLSGRGLRRALRWAVRGAHRERLRSLLRRARRSRDGDRHRMARARDAESLMGKT
jgi:pimeloyl-ACP methyl ester carboxylesterase